jgi:AraC-like DNA-binding protein
MGYASADLIVPAPETWFPHSPQRMVDRPKFVTTDVDAARHHLSQLTNGRCSLDVDQRSEFRFGDFETKLGSTVVHLWNWDSQSECQTSTVFPPNHHLVLHFPLTGEIEASEGSRSVRVKAGQVLVVSSQGVTSKKWRGPCQLLNIVVSRQALSRLLETNYGIVPGETLTFEPLAILELQNLATVTRYVDTVLADLSQESSLFREPTLAAQAEFTLLSMLLKTIPHKYREQINDRQSSIVPYYVRRAERFMLDSLQTPIETRALVDASGVSARTLYYGFKQYRNTTPMKYLKSLRLVRARHELLQSRFDGCKVSEIANKFGYPNFSQFSRDYREHFGESAAQTLRTPS